MLVELRISGDTCEGDICCPLRELPSKLRFLRLLHLVSLELSANAFSSILFLPDLSTATFRLEDLPSEAADNILGTWTTEFNPSLPCLIRTLALVMMLDFTPAIFKDASTFDALSDLTIEMNFR